MDSRLAIRMDARDMLPEVIHLYEELIDSGRATPDVFINLAHIYWQAVTDQDFTAWHGLNDEFVASAFEMDFQTLRRGMLDWPDNPEIRFWWDYFAGCCGSFSHAAPMSCRKARRFIEHPEGNNVPLICCLSGTLSDSDRDSIVELYQVCNKTRTQKNKFILRMLEESKVAAELLAVVGKDSPRQDAAAGNPLPRLELSLRASEFSR